MRSARLVLSLGVLVGGVASASAQLIFPITQDRHLEAQVEAPGLDTSLAFSDAPDMSLWVDAVAATVTETPEPNLIFTFQITGTAGQYSDIGVASLSAFGFADFHSQESFESSGRSESRYRVQFATAAPLAYQMSGTISAAVEGDFDHPDTSWFVDSVVTVRLDQVAGPLVYEQQAFVQQSCCPQFGPDPIVVTDSQTVGAAGVLQAGVYELEILAIVDATVEGFVTSDNRLFTDVSHVVQLDFAPIDPAQECDAADTDGDGDVDMLDWALFQQCFGGPAP